MKSSLLRAFLAIVVGVLMIVYPEQFGEWITRVIGVLFILAGVISIVSYAVARRHYDDDEIRRKATKSRQHTLLHKPFAPIVGIGCAALGFILALLPEKVDTALVYVFAALLLLGALGQFYILINAQLLLREVEKTIGERLPLSCGYGYWLLPILLFLFAVFTLICPQIVVNGTFLFVGIAMIVYAVAEITNAIKTYRVRRYVERQQDTVVVPVAAEEKVPLPAADDSTPSVEEAEIICDDDSPIITIDDNAEQK